MNELTNNEAEQNVASVLDVKPTYEKMIRKSAGISRTKDARKLQSLRSDIRTLQSDLQAQVAELETSATDIEDDLDRLAQKAKITTIHGQIKKLDVVLGAVQDQVTELLSA